MRNFLENQYVFGILDLNYRMNKDVDDKKVIDVTHSQYPFDIESSDKGTITIHYDDDSTDELKDSGLIVYRQLLKIYDINRDENYF